MFTLVSKSSGICEFHGFVSTAPAAGNGLVCPKCEPVFIPEFLRYNSERYVEEIYRDHAIWGTY